MKQLYDKLQQLKRVGRFETAMEIEVTDVPRKVSWKKEDTHLLCALFKKDFGQSKGIVHSRVIHVISNHDSAKKLLDAFSEEQIVAKVRYERQKRRRSK